MVVAVRTIINNRSTWARATITKTFMGQGKVEAFLVDYGRHVVALGSDLHHLSPCLTYIECQVSFYAIKITK